VIFLKNTKVSFEKPKKFNFKKAAAPRAQDELLGWDCGVPKYSFIICCQ